jgi:hypothetical protein
MNMSRSSTVYARPATFLLCFYICTIDKNDLDIQTLLSREVGGVVYECSEVHPKSWKTNQTKT